MAAEYIMLGGNHRVILCERGIRTFENYTRNTLDLSAVAVVKRLSHLPVICRPQPWHRQMVAGPADGQGGRCLGSRRLDGGGASFSQRGLV